MHISITGNIQLGNYVPYRALTMHEYMITAW